MFIYRRTDNFQSNRYEYIRKNIIVADKFYCKKETKMIVRMY
jgi:hypothetical protein